MARVAILSSWVCFGHVGLSAAVPALQALGHSAVQLPTVVLSNHPGWPRAAGDQVPTERLATMLDALEENGWLTGLDSMLTGYLPTPRHVDFALAVLERIRVGSPGIRLVLDPVLGDDPGGLYVPEETARAVRDRLVPRAQVLTPNRFELSWLTGSACETLADVRREAEALRDGMPGRFVMVTSAPHSAGNAGLLVADPETTRLFRTRRREGVPHGVGDVFSALVAAGLDAGAALGHLDVLIRASLGADHLRIAETSRDWTAAGAIPPDPMTETA